MISIPFFALLFIYGFFLFGFIVFSLVNISHLVSTGTLTAPSIFVTTLYIAFSVAILFFTWANLSGTDWLQPLLVWSTAWLTPVYTIGSAL